MKSNLKNQLIEYGQRVQQILNNAQSLEYTGLKDTDLLNLFQEIRSSIFQASHNMSRYLNNIATQVHWNKLNIALFGETNAGKSTLVEALCAGNGNSIGEGQKDCTKRETLREFESINLLDMPGIEGNEKKYERIIRDAVGKAHVVFFILGTGKEPEEGTLKKVQSYLKNQALVYSVYNLRAEPEKYKYNPELCSEADRTVIKRTEEKCYRILGSQYSGNLVVNAYLAYLANAHPERGNRNTWRFKKDMANKELAINLFESLDKALEFSNLKEVQTIIDQLSKRTKNEILISNSYKFMSLLERIIGQVLRAKKGYDQFLKDYQQVIEESATDARTMINKHALAMETMLKREMYIMETELLKITQQGINDNKNQDEIATTVNKLQEVIVARVKKEALEQLSEMKEDISDLIEPLKERLRISLVIRGGKPINIDMGRILEHLDITFKYIIEQAMEIGTTIWGVIRTFGLNPLLGIATAVIGFIKKIQDIFINDPHKRKKQAWKEAQKNIADVVQKQKKDIEKELNHKMSTIKKDLEQGLGEINQYIQDLWGLSRDISSYITEITRVKNEISVWLVEEVCANQVKETYIDLGMKRMVIIGNPIEGLNLNQTFRMEQVELFPELKDYLEHIAANPYNNWVELKNDDEFTFRALSSFMPSYKIRRVKND